MSSPAPRSRLGRWLRSLRGMLATAPGPARRWEDGLADELAFWDRWLQAADAPGFRFRMDPASRLQPWIERWLDPGRSTHRIVDVGSGPLTVLGRRSPMGEIEVTCCDPLAEPYMALLRRHGIAVQHPIVAVAGEELSARLPRGSFDVAFSNNALDHTRDPVRVLGEMACVTRIGGHVVVQVGEREGMRAGYTGLHQWDCSVDGDRLRIAARGGEPVDVAAALGGQVEPVLVEHVHVNPAGLPWDSPHIRAVFRRVTGSASRGSVGARDG